MLERDRIDLSIWISIFYGYEQMLVVYQSVLGGESNKSPKRWDSAGQGHGMSWSRDGLDRKSLMELENHEIQKGRDSGQVLGKKVVTARCIEEGCVVVRGTNGCEVPGSSNLPGVLTQNLQCSRKLTEITATTFFSEKKMKSKHQLLSRMSNTRIFSFMEHHQAQRNISISSCKHICNSTCQHALWKLSGTSSKVSYSPHLNKINSDWFISNI